MIDLYTWIIVGIIGVAFLVWKVRTNRGEEKEEMEFSEEVTSFFLTPRKTTEKVETGEELEGSAFEYDNGIYQMKSYIIPNGEKISLHSKDNPVPHGVKSGEDKNPTRKLARSNFLSGSLDNLTNIDRGGGTNIGKYLRMIPGEVYFLILVLIIVFTG